MSDSAFRRLLLDTVATVIAQPPSTSSLVELLRIATPSLLASSSDSKQRQQKADIIVRDASRREKLFRMLQLRIHPDKHAGNDRATVLFQEVTLFYGKCVDVMEIEGRRQRYPGVDVTSTNDDTNSDGVKPYKESSDIKSNNNSSSSTTNNQTPRWERRRQYPGNRSTGASTGASTGTPTHRDYQNCDYENSGQPIRTRNSNSTRSGRQPSSHQCCAVISLILFFPLGICALLHSFQVRRAWNDKRYGDARDHSDQAYSYAWFGCLCFGCLSVYIWVHNMDDGWNWDKMMDNFPSWDNGP